MNDQQLANLEAARTDTGQFGTQSRTIPGDLPTPMPVENLNEDDFDTRFGHVDPADGDFYVETDEASTYPDNQVWTAVDGDAGGIYLIPGYHQVNRIGYVISQRPWEHENIEVCIEEPEELGDGPFIEAPDVVAADDADAVPMLCAGCGQPEHTSAATMCESLRRHLDSQGGCEHCGEPEFEHEHDPCPGWLADRGLMRCPGCSDIDDAETIESAGYCADCRP